MVYWILLWPILKELDRFQKNQLLLLHTTLVHSVPLAVLVLDYFINAVPVIRRHFVAIAFVAVLYLFDNILVVKLSGRPIYPFLKWNDWTSIAITVFLFFFALACF